jgi:hypothetical protein
VALEPHSGYIPGYSFCFYFRLKVTCMPHSASRLLVFGVVVTRSAVQQRHGCKHRLRVLWSLWLAVGLAEWPLEAGPMVYWMSDEKEKVCFYPAKILFFFFPRGP